MAGAGLADRLNAAEFARQERRAVFAGSGQGSKFLVALSCTDGIAAVFM